MYAIISNNFLPIMRKLSNYSESLAHIVSSRVDFNWIKDMSNNKRKLISYRRLHNLIDF